MVGLKPTYGRVSRFGLLAFASSLDQIGPFTRYGRGRRDHARSDRRKRSERLHVGADRGARIIANRLPATFAVSESASRKSIGRRHGAGRRRGGHSAAIDKLRELGRGIVEVSLPHTKYALPTYYITAPAEASANLSRFDGVKYGCRKQAGSLREMYEQTRGEGFGPEVKRRIMLGTYALSSGYYDAYYVKAQKVRTLLKQDFE